MAPDDGLPAYCTMQDVKGENDNPDGASLDVLDGHRYKASRQMDRLLGWSFYQRSVTDEVRRGGDVVWGMDGRLLVRLPTPRVTAVTALAYRVGSPIALWVPVATNLLDYDPDDPQTATVAAYLPARPPGAERVWVQISYTAGWAGTPQDPYPLDIQEIAIWWTTWLWRSKDAPTERTANSTTGTVTIPSGMPPRLRQLLPNYKAPWAVF